MYENINTYEYITLWVMGINFTLGLLMLAAAGIQAARQWVNRERVNTFLTSDIHNNIDMDYGVIVVFLMVVSLLFGWMWPIVVPVGLFIAGMCGIRYIKDINRTLRDTEDDQKLMEAKNGGR